jgi:TonB family protein
MHESWMRELMMTISGWLVNYLAHSLVTLTVLGAVAWLGDRLLRRVGPQAQHRVWVVALLAGVALPLLPAGSIARYLGHTDATAVGGTVAVTYQIVAAATTRWPLTTLVSQVLASAYLLTVLFSMTRLLWRLRRTRAMVRRSAALPLDATARDLLGGAAREFRVTAPVIRGSTELTGPVVLGLRRATLLVPEGFFAAEKVEDMQLGGDGDVAIGGDGDIGIGSDGDVGIGSDGDVAAALAHECAHIARSDYAKNLLYECVAAAVAYHPASWRMRRRIAETRELVCDERAAGAMGDRPEYAASLLRLARAMAGPAARPFHASATQAIGVFDADILEERVMRLTMDVPKVSRTRRIAMAVVAACALLGGAATATALSFDVTPQDGAVSAPAHEKIYKVGNGVTPPVLTYSVDAEFTKKAKDAKHQGVSVVSCVVDTDGMPRHVHTVRKLGMGLDEKAIEAVRQYKFKPSTLHGKPVAVQITIEVNFHIY